jgi:hypothetical protein
MSPAHLIALFLATRGVGTFAGNVGWSINVAGEPASPPNTVTIYDTGGEGPDTDELDWLRPTLQIRVRAESYAEGYAKQEKIRDLLVLDQPIAITHKGKQYEFIGVAMQSDILAIGRDESDRHLLTANYRAIKVREAA